MELGSIPPACTIGTILRHLQVCEALTIGIIAAGQMAHVHPYCWVGEKSGGYLRGEYSGWHDCVNPTRRLITDSRDCRPIGGKVLCRCDGPIVVQVGGIGASRAGVRGNILRLSCDGERGRNKRQCANELSDPSVEHHIPCASVMNPAESSMEFRVFPPGCAIGFRFCED